MADSDDDFGGLNDDDLLAAENQASVDKGFATSPRLAKRVRLSEPDIPLRVLGGSPRQISGQHGVGSSEDRPLEVSSQQEYGRSRLAAPQNNLRQTTLFGAQAAEQQSSQQTRRHNWPLARKDEPPTHHKLDRVELSTWVYPINLGRIRDYQYNIVARGLYHNLLVALPTGLGKTFIAATVMLNWYRWTKESQIVFVAPTRPLVSQQVDACFKIAGIPRSATTMLTGGIPPAVRAEEWQEKRVFFMTPQTIINDLQSGICDPKKIVLIVVDEAHRATGNYAYVEVVRFLRRFSTSFRVLALTATPGSTVEGVQEVIDGLGISRVEIRTEESLDIREYVHQRNIETTLFDYSEEMTFCMDHFGKALQPLVNKLRGFNAYWSANPMTLTPYGCNQAMKKWMASDAGQRANWGLKSMVMSIFSILASLAHAIELLKFHGIGPFFHKLVDFRRETQEAGGKGSKYKKEVIDSGPFLTLMRTVQAWINNKDFIGHPKLEALRSITLNHFMDAGEGKGIGAEAISPARTRIMVFAHYRDSAEEISRVLNRNSPMIRPHVFVGQAHSKGSEGMDQKKQLEIIEKFRSGVYNTLVATSIGEEGLDIGEVDLIVCYDGSASPIRMLQRMGRTGRKRSGRIEVLLMKDKEHDNFMKAKDNYEKMQEMIASGQRFTFHEDLSPRIVPRDVQPEVDKRVVDIPVENTQADLPEPKRRSKPGKRPPKRFNMPDGVQNGFTKASRITSISSNRTETQDEELPPRSPSPVPIPSDASIFLTDAETADLERTYLSISGENAQIVESPRLDRYPNLQRSMRPTAYLGHGRASKGLATMLSKIHRIGNSSAATVTTAFESNLDAESRDMIDLKHSQISHHDLLLDDQTLFGISSLASGKQQSQGSGLSQQSLDSRSYGADEVDTGSDLADFIDDCELTIHEAGPSSCSSPPLAVSTPLNTADTTPIISSQLSGEIPDVDELLLRSKIPLTPGKGNGRKSRHRRTIVDSESEDEH